MGDKTAAEVKAEQEKKFKHVTVVREGKQIVIPEGMSYALAREWLVKIETDEETKVGILEDIEAFPLEGAYALRLALDEVFGFFQMETVKTMFGERPPFMISMATGVNETEQVPWGRITIPGVAGFIESGLTMSHGRVIYRISGETKKKHAEQFKQLGQTVRRLVKEKSVYRGKAFQIDFKSVDDESFNPMNDGPRFMDTSKVDPEKLVFPDKVQRVVQDSVYTPIEFTDECRKHAIPLKRGVLLEGPYGTGKTLCANVTAKKSVENGWTFIYLTDVTQLKEALVFARAYQPAVVFAEDIDRVVTGDRSKKMDEILNTIDGVDTKKDDIMVVLTTNHVDNINPALLRPGRLDAVISVRPPDAEAAIRLVRLYSGGLLNSADELTEVGGVLQGQIPAVIREVVERSKLGAIGRASKGGRMQLTSSDLLSAAEGMLNHLKLLAVKPNDTRSDVEKAAEVLGRHINRQVPVSNGSSRFLPESA
jgi:SpoVK/Ycf46/Vps4 family AAA+-type ATPase